MCTMCISLQRGHAGGRIPMLQSKCHPESVAFRIIVCGSVMPTLTCAQQSHADMKGEALKRRVHNGMPA